MTRFRRALIVLCILSAILFAEERGARAEDEPSDSALLRDFPGLSVSRGPDRIAVYGRPMTAARSAESAAGEWLAAYSAALGVTPEQLVLRRKNLVRYGKFTAFAYAQQYHGRPVEGSQVRVLVLEPEDASVPGALWRVVYAAASRVVSPPKFRTVVIRPETLSGRIQRDPRFRDLDRFGDAERVVLPPLRGEESRDVWKIPAANSDLAKARGFTFFVDVESGELVEVRNEVCHADLEGTVSGFVTPGGFPHSASNPPEEVVLPGAEVSAAGVIVEADADGLYRIVDLEEEPTDVSTQLTGPWIEVRIPGPETTLEAVATPPATVDLVFNESGTEESTAEATVFAYGHATHDFYRDRFPDFEGVDQTLVANTNVDSSCSAFFTTFPLSINFFTSGTANGNTCPNTAYRSVVAHEYGHFVVYKLGLAQGAFGEGFSDVMSVLQFDDPIIAPDLFGPGTERRDIVEANQQFPCAGEIHICGQILGGVWWDLRLELGDTLGMVDGLTEAQQLFVDWSAVTTGGSGTNSAHEGTIIEVLVVDDDDGDLQNGTPHAAEICTAFAAHGIEGPAFDTVGLAFDEGRPELLEANVVTTFPVRAFALAGEPAESTGLLYVSVNGGPFVESSMPTSAPNEYTVELPAEECPSSIRYYVTVEDADGELVTSPRGAPDHSFLAVTGISEIDLFVDDFESANGWSVGDPNDPDTATASGRWVRVNPLRSPAQPEADVTVDGTICYVTGQGNTAGALTTHDVDGGKTTLVSPELNTLPQGSSVVSYWRWYSNDRGPAPNEDVFRVELTEDGGDTWVEVESVGPDGPGTSGGWVFHRFDVSEFATLGAAIQLRFVAEDTGAASVVEAAIDDFRLTFIPCEPWTGEIIRGDCNVDGEAVLTDVVFFLEYSFLGGPTPDCLDACDADDSGVLSLGDAIALLEVLFIGAEPVPPFPGCGEDESVDTLSCDFFPVCQ